MSIEKERETINAQVMTDVEASAKYAVESPFPDPEAALEDIFSE